MQLIMTYINICHKGRF